MIVVKSANTGEKIVQMIHPFVTKDFGIRALADRIFDLDGLLYLYPDTPKDTAFGRHYSPEPSKCNSENFCQNIIK